jgi:hypothetical protein
MLNQKTQCKINSRIFSIKSIIQTTLISSPNQEVNQTNKNLISFENEIPKKKTIDCQQKGTTKIRLRKILVEQSPNKTKTLNPKESPKNKVIIRKKIRKSKKKIDRQVKTRREKRILQRALKTGNLYLLEELYEDVIFEFGIKTGPEHQVDLNNLKRGFSMFKKYDVYKDLYKPKVEADNKDCGKHDESLQSTKVSISLDTKHSCQDTETKEIEKNNKKSNLITIEIDNDDSLCLNEKDIKHKETLTSRNPEKIEKEESTGIFSESDGSISNFEIVINKNNYMLDNKNFLIFDQKIKEKKRIFYDYFLENDHNSFLNKYKKINKQISKKKRLIGKPGVLCFQSDVILNRKRYGLLN